jgi:hypothetical protein
MFWTRLLRGILRFFTAFAVSVKSPLFRDCTESTAVVGASRSASPPDFLSKLLSLFLGGFVNDLAAGVMFASGVLQDCLCVLRESVCSGVVLARPFPLVCLRHCDTKARVAPLAKPL